MYDVCAGFYIKKIVKMMTIVLREQSFYKTGENCTQKPVACITYVDCGSSFEIVRVWFVLFWSVRTDRLLQYARAAIAQTSNHANGEKQVPLKKTLFIKLSEEHFCQQTRIVFANIFFCVKAITVLRRNASSCFICRLRALNCARSVRDSRLVWMFAILFIKSTFTVDIVNIAELCG